MADMVSDADLGREAVNLLARLVRDGAPYALASVMASWETCDYCGERIGYPHDPTCTWRQAVDFLDQFDHHD